MAAAPNRSMCSRATNCRTACIITNRREIQRATSFIDYLPKGTYVFEYSVRVQHRGQYQTGFAAIGCMYAPEFNSHSESLVLTVE